MSRAKLYYPKSSITENLITFGGEYMFESGVMYTGYYHKYDTGEVFSGPMWDANKSLKLLPYVDVSNIPNFKVNDTDKLKSFLTSDVNLKRYRTPISTFNKPTQADYQRGYYYRYFSVKRNEPAVIAEISAAQFVNFGNAGGINPFLFKVDKIKWHLMGQEFDKKNNSGIVISHGIIDNNAREVLALSRDYPYIYVIFGDYRQFTEHSRTQF